MKMKNKKAEQAEAREINKSQRRNGKKLKRRDPILQEKPTILIICEGQNTEPSYFKKFKLSTATIKPIGEGYNTVSLIKRAIELAKNDHYDQVWCVFDKDDFPDTEFNNAIHMAESNGFGIAYTNQAF